MLPGDSAQPPCPATNNAAGQLAVENDPSSSGTLTWSEYGNIFAKFVGAVAGVLIAPFCEVALILNPLLQFTVAVALLVPATEKSAEVKGVFADSVHVGGTVHWAVTVTVCAVAGVANNTAARSAPGTE